MTRVCPKCKYPQEGILECEYCGFKFDKPPKIQITEKSTQRNAAEKVSELLKIVVTLIAFIGFFAMVYFWYQYESEKKMVQLEESKKLEVSEKKSDKEQQDVENDGEKAVITKHKIQDIEPLTAKSKHQEIESEKTKPVSPTHKTENAVTPVITEVVCNRFHVNTLLKGKQLEFWLDTDLPNDTGVMIRVSRLYWIKGSSGTYSGAYYGKRLSVRELQKPVEVIIDEAAWRRQIEKKHELTEPAGKPVQVSKINDKIELHVTVPINQDNPAFGRRNVNLKGKMVTAEHDFKIIRVEKTFIVPFR
jgi:hypothetical protein